MRLHFDDSMIERGTQVQPEAAIDLGTLLAPDFNAGRQQVQLGMLAALHNVYVQAAIGEIGNAQLADQTSALINKTSGPLPEIA